MSSIVKDNIPEIDNQRKVVFVFACPGNEELEKGKPCAGQTGKNLEILLRELNRVNPDLFDSLDRYDYRIVNSSTIVHPESEDDDSVPSAKAIKTQSNLDRFNSEINSDDHIICFGKQAVIAIKFYKRKNKYVNLDFKQTSHLSLSALNRSIKLEDVDDLTPEERNVKRVIKSAENLIKQFTI